MKHSTLIDAIQNALLEAGINAKITDAEKVLEALKAQGFTVKTE